MIFGGKASLSFACSADMQNWWYNLTNDNIYAYYNVNIRYAYYSVTIYSYYNAYYNFTV